MRDDQIHGSLERLHVPPQSPTFFDDLWQNAEANERRAARRWRRAAIALGALVVSAGTAAGVFAVGRAGGATVVDKTLACHVLTALDSGSFGFSAQVKEPPVSYNGGLVLRPGDIVVGGSGGVQPFATYAAAEHDLVISNKPVKAGYFFDNTVCGASRAIPLSHTGLPFLGVFSRAGTPLLSRTCDAPNGTVVTVRLRVVLSAANEPAAAQLAVRAGKRQQPVAFVDWTPTRVRAWSLPGCVAH